MDHRGSLVDTNLKIYPSEKFIAFIQTIPLTGDVPSNILKYLKEDLSNVNVSKTEKIDKTSVAEVHFTSADVELLNKIKKITNDTNKEDKEINDDREKTEAEKNCSLQDKEKSLSEEDQETIKDDDDSKENSEKLFLNTSDVEWVHAHINIRKSKGEDVPYLHEIFQGTNIVMPENRLIKRNPILEARCVKLRAQQEAREYRKMTKGVDNVRMRYPEDTISYQLKQMNRQLIAIGQFIISIFAGFLFGFRGVEWMVGNLDFGVRLLLGVMCALIIALAEIYFLAKKLNEELTMTETVQLGGPPKFAYQPNHIISNSTVVADKEHQD